MAVSSVLPSLVVCATSQVAEGKEGNTPSDPAPAEAQSPHANVLALSFAYQSPLSLEKSLPLGGGIFYTREYFVTRRTALGIHVGVRAFPSSPWHIAIGYGLTFKHYVGSLGNAGPGSGLYLLYGLLLQMNLLEGHSGSDTGHDTRLAIGYDWKTSNLFPVVELGYHLTQLRNFDEDTLWWPYTELALGLRF